MRAAVTFFILVLASAPALAVHECGTAHEETSAASGGCSRLKESDFFYGDPRADAPELAQRGKYQVGVRTLRVVNPRQLDILNYTKGKPEPRYDRPLTLEVWQAGNAEYQALLDSRIKVLVAFAPYAPPGFWSTDAMRSLNIPSFFIVGSQDQTTGYAAARWLFEHAVNAERYLLVFQGAIHEVATNPAPPLAQNHFREYVHYQEPAWDNRRLNNVNQHFVTAFLGTYLKDEPAHYARFLKLSPISNDSPRTDTAAPGYWKGFANWTAIGMEFHHARAREDN